MILNRLNAFWQAITNLLHMTRLAWQAQPILLVGYIGLELLQGTFPLATALITKFLFDLLGEVLQAKTEFAMLLPKLLGLLLAQVVLVVVSKMGDLWGNYLYTELGRKLTLHVKTLVYQKIIGLDGLTYFETPRFYDTIQLATRGAENGPMQVISTSLQLAQNFLSVVGFIGVLFLLNPVLPVVIMVAALPELYINLKVGQQQMNLAVANISKLRLASYYSSILDQVHYAKELRLFKLGRYFMDAFLRTMQDTQQAERTQQLRELRYQLFLGTLSSLVSGGAFVLVIIQAASGQISLGDITFYISALGSVQGGLLSFTFSIAELNKALLFYTHFTNLMALPQPIHIPGRGRPLTPLVHGIELRQVSFRYSEEHPWVLRNVNLFIPAGCCLALVGLNGAGKTTLVKLLTRLYDPTEGQILWDGRDIREFDPADFRQKISAIFQDFVRFDLSAQENIGVGQVDHIQNLPCIQQAAMNAGLHHDLEKLPYGYQTVLSRWLANGQGAGVDLSGGQWQKVGLARMLMRQADLLILDEPSAALDAQAEYELYNHFVKLVSQQTTLLISHRFSTVRMAHQVAVLQEGQIIEAGSHEELMQQGNTYARLYHMQAQRYS